MAQVVAISSGVCCTCCQQQANKDDEIKGSRSAVALLCRRFGHASVRVWVDRCGRGLHDAPSLGPAVGPSPGLSRWYVQLIQQEDGKVEPSGNIGATRGKKQHYRIVEIAAVRRSRHSSSRLTRKHRRRKLMVMAETRARYDYRPASYRIVGHA